MYNRSQFEASLNVQRHHHRRSTARSLLFGDDDQGYYQMCLPIASRVHTSAAEQARSSWRSRHPAAATKSGAPETTSSSYSISLQRYTKSVKPVRRSLFYVIFGRLSRYKKRVDSVIQLYDNAATVRTALESTSTCDHTGWFRDQNMRRSINRLR